MRTRRNLTIATLLAAFVAALSILFAPIASASSDCTNPDIVCPPEFVPDPGPQGPDGGDTPTTTVPDPDPPMTIVEDGPPLTPELAPPVVETPPDQPTPDVAPPVQTPGPLGPDRLPETGPSFPLWLPFAALVALSAALVFTKRRLR